ncbi:MAG: potassium-transporting ATPase subunit KdpC [Bacteroidales bacterium]
MMTKLIISIRAFLLLTLLTGLIYPLLVTGIAGIVFPDKANGSLIMKNDSLIGSELIGQRFSSDRYFNSRPSTTGYSPLPSSGSNLGPSSRKLVDSVDARRDSFVLRNRLDSSIVVPAEMLFASGSGLDPHISPMAAILQVERIASNRHFNLEQQERLLELIRVHSEPPQWKFLGEPRVNVLKLNIALDELE